MYDLIELPTVEQAVALIVEQWAAEFRVDYFDEFGSPEEVEGVIDSNRWDWRDYARDQVRQARKPKLVNLDRDVQLADLSRRIEALKRDITAFRKRFGEVDAQVVEWLRAIRAEAE